MNLSRSNLTPADCGFCGLEGPDSFGNYDLIETPNCPHHGEGVAEVQSNGDRRNAFEPAPKATATLSHSLRKEAA